MGMLAGTWRVAAVASLRSSVATAGRQGARRGYAGSIGASGIGAGTPSSRDIPVREVSKQEALKIVAKDGRCSQSELKHRRVGLVIAAVERTGMRIAVDGPKCVVDFPAAAVAPFYHGQTFPRAHVAKVLGDMNAADLARLSAAAGTDKDWASPLHAETTKSSPLWLDKPLSSARTCRRHIANGVALAAADTIETAAQQHRLAGLLPANLAVPSTQAVHAAVMVAAGAYELMHRQPIFYRLDAHAIWQPAGRWLRQPDCLPALVSARVFEGQTPRLAPRQLVHPGESEALRLQLQQLGRTALTAPLVFGLTLATGAFASGGIAAAVGETWGVWGPKSVDTVLQTSAIMGKAGALFGLVLTAGQGLYLLRSLPDARQRLQTADLAAEHSHWRQQVQLRKAQLNTLVAKATAQEEQTATT